MKSSRSYRLLAVLLVSVLGISGCADIKSATEGVVRNLRGNRPSPTQPQQTGPGAETLMLRASEAINSRRYEEGYKVLAELGQSPGHNERWVTYGEAFIANRLGRYDEALSLIESINPRPYESAFLSLKAEILFSMHRVEEAWNTLERVAERTGAYDADTLFMLRDIALELGKLDEARALESDLQTYHGLDPNGVIAAYGRAMLDRDLVSAAEALDRLVSLPMEGEAGEDVSAHYSPSILHGRAEIAMAQGEVDRAAEILRGIAASDPHATSVWPALAWLALQTGRMADARTWAIEGLIYCSAEEVIDDLRIAVPDSLKDVEKPTRLLRRAETAHLLVVLGYVALSTGGTDEALKYCGKALEMNPYNEDAFLLKARALELSGDTEEAVHVVVQGLRTAPEDDGLAMRHVILARHAPGTLGPTDPDPDSVLEDLLEECRGRHEMFPADPESAYMLARLFMLSGEEGAGELLEYAYKTEPHMTAYSLCYAAHLAETGDLEGALGVVESAGLAPDLLWLYDSYYRVGETESKAFLDFTDRVWDRMDPERRFAPVLDPLRNAAEVACGIESP